MLAAEAPAPAEDQDLGSFASASPTAILLHGDEAPRKRLSLHPPHPFIRKARDREAFLEKDALQAVCAGPYEAARTAENLLRDPSLRQCSGVRAVCVDPAVALRLGTDLLARWVPFGSLKLPGCKRIRGYNTYTNVHAPHDAALQQEHTLLLTGALLVHARRCLDGFAEMADSLAAHLGLSLGGNFVLVFAHALRQGPRTRMSTGFSSHQDNETDELIDRSVVVKLTADFPGEEASRMTVLGAACPFAYGPAAGAAGHFESRLWHYSNPPKSKREHLKVAFFFRRRYSTRDMRAARGRGVN